MRRVLDLTLSAALVVVLVPLFALLALAVRVSSPGPALYRQERYGRDMRQFTLLKFRTMYHDASDELHRAYIASLAAGEEAASEGVYKLVHDPRVTRVGKFLRKTSLDELPQLLNVLVGHMSLVGPRPALDYELDHYEPRHFDRFAVEPGLTGLWQVSGRSELGFREMLELDADYANAVSPRLDLGILFRTPLALVRHRAA